MRNTRIALLPRIIVIVLLLGVAAAAFAQERSELERQLNQLEQEAETLDKSVQQTQGEARNLTSEVKTIDTEVKRRELEIRRLTLAIKKTGIEIRQKTEGVALLTRKIEKGRAALAGSLFLLSTQEDDDGLSILLKHRSLSDFFNAVQNLDRVQSDIQDTVSAFKDDRTQLEREKEALNLHWVKLVILFCKKD